MDFTKLAQKFLSLTGALEISANAQCLYFQLLYTFYSKFGSATFELDNMTLASRTKLSRQQIRNARLELQNYGFIYYENGSGSRAGKYTVIDIENLKNNSIIDLSKLNDVKIDNLAALSREVDNLSGDWRIWGQYIIKVLRDSIQNNKSGVYANYYATSQLFLKASDAIKFDTLQKIITYMQYKPDIQNREAYILTIIANEVKQMQREQKLSAR